MSGTGRNGRTEPELLCWQDKVMRLMAGRGITVVEVERSAGLSQGVLSQAISERANLSIVDGTAVARRLSVSTDWLFDYQRPWDEHKHSIPRFSVHCLDDMPCPNDSIKWNGFDWAGVAKAIDDGKAVRVAVPVSEIHQFRNRAAGRLGRINTSYDKASEALWVCRKDAHWNRRREAIGRGPDLHPSATGNDVEAKHE